MTTRSRYAWRDWYWSDARRTYEPDAMGPVSHKQAFDMTREAMQEDYHMLYDSDQLVIAYESDRLLILWKE